MLSLSKLKEIEAQPTLFDMPTIEDISQEDMEYEPGPSYDKQEFDRLNIFWKNFYEQRGETNYEKMTRIWSKR